MNTIIEKKKRGRKPNPNNLCPWCGSTMESSKNVRVQSKKCNWSLKEFVNSLNQPESVWLQIKQPEIRTKNRHCKNPDCDYKDYVKVNDDKTIKILRVKQPSKLYKIMEDFMNNTEPINDNELNDILEKLRNS